MLFREVIIMPFTVFDFGSLTLTSALKCSIVSQFLNFWPYQHYTLSLWFVAQIRWNFVTILEACMWDCCFVHYMPLFGKSGFQLHPGLQSMPWLQSWGTLSIWCLQLIWNHVSLLGGQTRVCQIWSVWVLMSLLSSLQDTSCSHPNF